MKKLIIILTGILITLTGYGQFTGKMIFHTMDEDKVFTVYSADAGYRYEFNENNSKGIVIVKKDSPDVLILMPDQKMAMKSPATSSMSIGSDPIKSYEQYKNDGILKEIGKETINGEECTKSILYDKDNPNKKLYTIWYSEKYKFPLKMTSHVEGEEGSGMEMKDIKPWTPDPTSFSIPSGYQLMDMPGMNR